MQQTSKGPSVVDINGSSVIGCRIPGKSEIVYGMTGKIVGGVITTLDCPARKQGLCQKNNAYRCPKAHLLKHK